MSDDTKGASGKCQGMCCGWRVLACLDLTSSSGGHYGVLHNRRPQLRNKDAAAVVGVFVCLQIGVGINFVMDNCGYGGHT